MFSWAKPFHNLLLGVEFKAPIALLITLFWDAFVLQMQPLIKVPPDLIFGALVMFVLDFVAGIYAAKKRGERISSAGLRQACSKAFAYMMFAVASVIVTNTLRDTLFNTVTQYIATGAFAYIILTELFSVIENVFGRAEAANILKRFGIVAKHVAPESKPIIDAIEADRAEKPNENGTQ